MVIGIPREIKAEENRIAITPAAVDILVRAGHKVLIERGAGEGSGFSDEMFKNVGGIVVKDAETVWSDSDMIIKVKEPLPPEYNYFRENLILFTYLHLANEPTLSKALMEKKVIAFAYETVQREDNALPLLRPMSEIAGRLSIQEGALFLEKTRGGKGILLEGIAGVSPANVTVVGAGTAGLNAAKRALNIGARVTVLDINIDRLQYLEERYHGQVETLYSNYYNLMEAISKADLVVGAVLIPGAKAPKVITEEMVRSMKPGGVIVDVAIDQGGCVETCDSPTTHLDPIYIKFDIIHYAVPNIPSIVSRTATLALCNVTLPYIIKIVNLGWKKAIREDKSLAKGLNVVSGRICYEAVAEAHGLPYTSIEEIIN